jgi:hypothetical protein
MSRRFRPSAEKTAAAWYRESAESWADLLRDCARRGMRCRCWPSATVRAAMGYVPVAGPALAVTLVAVLNWRLELRRERPGKRAADVGDVDDPDRGRCRRRPAAAGNLRSPWFSRIADTRCCGNGCRTGGQELMDPILTTSMPSATDRAIFASVITPTGRASAHAGAHNPCPAGGRRLAESLCARGADRLKIEYTVVPCSPGGSPATPRPGTYVRRARRAAPPRTRGGASRAAVQSGTWHKA